MLHAEGLKEFESFGATFAPQTTILTDPIKLPSIEITNDRVSEEDQLNAVLKGEGAWAPVMFGTVVTFRHHDLLKCGSKLSIFDIFQWAVWAREF